LVSSIFRFKNNYFFRMAMGAKIMLYVDE